MILKMKIWRKNLEAKSLASTIARVDILQTSVLPSAKQKKGKHFEKKERYIKHEVNVMLQKRVKKALKQKKKTRIDELCTFENMSVSDSEQESMNSSSSKEGEV